MENLKRKNLRSFLEEFKVIIPILQRDYAQGRRTQKGLANLFLDSIFEVLNGSKDGLHIDFIYGYEEKGNFLLIDGQQRITTLWLLYFYLNRLLDVSLSELGNFSYSVRKSSKKFCGQLLKNDFDLHIKPSLAIKNKSGVFETSINLENDPTIKSMLGMLDLIYERVKNSNKEQIEKYANRLDDITFSLFNMGSYGLGEELYIKMNSRGKQLSAYENLKAYMVSFLPFNDELLSRIDNRWCDLFFQNGSVEKFDEIGRNFLHYANIFFVLCEKREAQIANIKEQLDPKRRVDDFYSYIQKRENIVLLDRCVELILRLKNDLRDSGIRILEDDFFHNKQKGEMSYINICYFHSLLAYVQEQNKQNFSTEKIVDYLRVSKHFIENHRLGNAEDVVQLLELFRRVARGAEDVYEYLVMHPESDIHSQIYALEVRKARLIREGEDWEAILNKMSDNSILVGRVDFLLDFCDREYIYESYSLSNFYDRKKDEKTVRSKYQNPDLEKFNQYAYLLLLFLNKNFLERHLILFQRAFLVFGNYGFYATNYFYGNVPHKMYRDNEAWNWLLSGVANDARLPYLKIFLDSLTGVTNEFELVTRLEEIIQETDFTSKSWWEQLMIGEERNFEFLRERKEKFQQTSRVRFHRDINGSRVEKVELLPKTKSRTGVKDLFDYSFYLFCQDVCLLDEKVKVTRQYESDEEQCGFQNRGRNKGIKSHFSLNNLPIVCHSGKRRVWYGDYEFEIDFDGTNLFEEFQRIFNKIRELV